MDVLRPETGAPTFRFRTVTWNCHGSVGSDWRCDPSRIVATIDRLKPDILALQEVDGRTQFGRRAHAFEFFAERLGGHLAEARTLPRSRGRDFGHLLWSRWPFDATRVELLPGPGLEPRAAIIGHVTTPAGSLRIIAFHLALLPSTRKRQAAAILGLAGDPSEPILALGDTNEWRSKGGVDRRLSAALPRCVAPGTWPARWPTVPMDRIYASKRLHLLAGRADHQAAGASDHLPVVADWALSSEDG